MFDSFINTLASSIDARDKITAGHSSRVKLYSMLIVDELGLDEHKKEIIEKAATLHDIGKIGIRDSVLQKEGKLTDEEYKHIQEHVQITYNILENIGLNEDFKEINEIACSHHEKYDGTGYHRHLKGEDIPYGGRILAVSDVFDAITSKRHYRDKMPIVNVIDILLKGRNTHFDAKLVDVFLKIPVNKIVKVFLTENHNKLKAKDDKTLSKYNLSDIYNMGTKENPTEEEKEIVSLFNYYYSGKQD
ncbi:HD domain-containing protein [bacterium]|nr:HD domain-containing protein [bacterium]